MVVQWKWKARQAEEASSRYHCRCPVTQRRKVEWTDGQPRSAARTKRHYDSIVGAALRGRPLQNKKGGYHEEQDFDC